MSVLVPPAPTTSSPPTSNVPTLPIYRFSVDQYHRMIEAGILTEDDPVELLHGWLVEKMPKNRPRTLATRRARALLESLKLPSCYVDSQEPLTLPDSEPEPDVLLIRGDPEQYADHQPGPSDVHLIIEVADSTLERDRGEKSQTYAEAGVAVYWIVNLVDHQIEVRTGPTLNGYSQERVFRAGEAVPVVIDGAQVGQIRVDDVLP